MKSPLDSLIEELEAGTWQVSEASETLQEARGAEAWPHASLDAERRFGQPHAKLFPFIGRKVRTTKGTGTLIQVFAERVTVVLDADLEHCDRFPPGEIEPVSWEV